MMANGADVIIFPGDRVAPGDWLLEDLEELREMLLGLPITETSLALMRIVYELIEGRELELEGAHHE